MEMFNVSQYFSNMEKLGKKKKDLHFLTNIIEQYDFYMKSMLFEQLIMDQTLDKNPNLRSLIQMELRLEGIPNAKVSLDNYENQLQQTMVQLGNDKENLVTSKCELFLEYDDLKILVANKSDKKEDNPEEALANSKGEAKVEV